MYCGKGNIKCGKRNMLLKSYYKELDLVFYNLNLKSAFFSKELRQQKVAISEDDFTIYGQIFGNKNFCIIHAKRNNAKVLTEHVTLEGPYVKIAYLVNGSINISRDNGKKITLQFGKLDIGYGNSFYNKITFPAHKASESLLLYISVAYFKDILAKESWGSQSMLLKALLAKQKDQPTLTSYIVDLPLQRILMDILKCHIKEEHKIPYIELKIRELFLMLHTYDSEQESISELIPTHILDKVQQAKLYIDTHYTSTPTVKFLSRYVLLNEIQLKNNFKIVYGTTIRSYIIDLKMKKAYQLIYTHPVNEITNMLGYQSVSHFISTFKKYYGNTPSKMTGKHI